MAASTTVATILVLFNGTVFTPDVIAFASEIILMTGSAERCVLR